MKLKRILSIPFAVAADVVTLGNMGERSFTQQVFDADRREKNDEALLEFVRILAGKK